MEEPYTEVQILDAAITAGIPEDFARRYYLQYSCQGWLRGNGLPITRPANHMRLLYLKNPHMFDTEEVQAEPKRKLPILFGKTCSHGQCKMPAVYRDSSGSYDHYYCADHLPSAVRKRYG